MTSGGSLHCRSFGRPSEILAFSSAIECDITTAFHPRAYLGLRCLGKFVAGFHFGVSLSLPSVSLVLCKSYPLGWLPIRRYILHSNRSFPAYDGHGGG